ncbi:MAG TPA: sigma-70 family RNA polymerase sigma factor [Gemmataceae bacterium]|nr:sigma-70 family RNA polymerase sigma factor [Gemmataceae bacterium]
MTEPAEEFAALLERVRRGDEDAAAELVQRYEGVVRRAARGLLGPALRSYLDSVDLAQSVHRSLLIGLRNQKFDISSPDKLVALALTLVRRKVARHWRKIKRACGGTPVPAGDTEQALASRSSLPPDPASRVQLDDAIRHILDYLDDETDRRLVELRLQGYSTAEVARAMGLDARFLRVRLGRLRSRLRDRGLLTEWL